VDKPLRYEYDKNKILYRIWKLVFNFREKEGSVLAMSLRRMIGELRKRMEYGIEQVIVYSCRRH